MLAITLLLHHHAWPSSLHGGLILSAANPGGDGTLRNKKDVVKTPEYEEHVLP
jgi:hypothetical protein